MVEKKLFLAPMEGLADYVLRDVLTQIGGYDGATCEFIRVSDTLLPHRVYRRYCPELDNGSRTPAGTPVAVQLLGSDPVCMAENAAKLCELKPAGVDLNFGCPAKLVNRHGGGAMLLDDPERLFSIASAVRRSVPKIIPFTAKMRLGVDDTSKALDCARALEAGGVEALVVHARTRRDGYKPPAHWEWIDRIAREVRVPVVANGEIWSLEDYARCRQVSGCENVMLGRGAISDPFLARRIRAQAAGEEIRIDRTAEWQELLPMLSEYWRLVQGRVAPCHVAGRLKTWLSVLRRTFVEAEELFQTVRTSNNFDETSRLLIEHGVPVDCRVSVDTA